MFDRDAMNGWLWLVCSVLVCGVYCSAKSDGAETADVPRPNIVLMLADDMGMGDTSAYQDITGNTDREQIDTPNLERLARMGVRLTDAHTPSSRCSPTRYGLLTGRYPWRNRLKFWVLFGAQGDPMIERDRPTIATMLADNGYHTAMVGKWHVGLRYRNSSGGPAAEFSDADFSQPMFDTPLDHGFDHCWFTSRSHGTSGPAAGTKRNVPDQMVGPGHVDGRTILGATGQGRQLVDDGPQAYVLNQLGGRHSDRAIQFLQSHTATGQHRDQPFFLYYPSNSNHSPYTPDEDIAGQPVAGAAHNKAGELMNRRSDYIYENDVALGRMLDFLESHDDPRHPGKKLIETTLVIFTSDNGAEIKDKFATGPFRSNKGSTYEGGHRVPFIAAFSAAGIGNGDPLTPGRTSSALIGLVDLYATFAELTGGRLPNLRAGEKGAEDSISVLTVLQGEQQEQTPRFYHDKKEADDPAAAAMRLDSPTVHGRPFPGQWKMHFDAGLIRRGIARPTELYELQTDQQEKNNRVDDPALAELVTHLVRVAQGHRQAGGHRWVNLVSGERVVWDFRAAKELDRDNTHQELWRTACTQIHGQPITRQSVTGRTQLDRVVQLDISGEVSNEVNTDPPVFHLNARGLGISSGTFQQVDDGERLLLRFDQDVIVESAAIVAGNGRCGGFYQVGSRAPLAIYCVDDDIDSKDQSGILSDIGLVRKGELLIFDSGPHYGVETAGRWRLQSLTIQLLND